jgi:MFS family permease
MAMPKLVVPPRLTGLGRSLRHRNFALFFAGQLVSLVGTWMQTVAQAWLIYRLTGSAALLGTIGFASQVPVFLLSAIGGALADRHNRHRILICTQSAAMVLAAVLAGLTLSGQIQVWQVAILAASLGLVNAFDIPARQSFLVELVGREDLQNAIALNSSMFNSARLVGPAVAGILVGAVGEGWCFLLNAISFLAVIGGLLAMRLEKRLVASQQGSVFTQAAEGLSYVARTAPIRALLLLVALMSFMGMPYSVLMPIFADRILGGGPEALGALMGAAGVGALCGALALAARKGLRGLGQWIAACSAIFGVALVVFALSTSFILSLIALAVVGFAMMTQMGASNTLLQSMVPEQLRGRAMAAYSMMFMGVAPFGSLAAGLAAEQMGARAVVIGGGVCCLVGALVFQRYLPGLRDEARVLIEAQHMAAGARPVGQDD